MQWLLPWHASERTPPSVAITVPYVSKRSSSSLATAPIFVPCCPTSVIHCPAQLLSCGTSQWFQSARANQHPGLTAQKLFYGSLLEEAPQNLALVSHTEPPPPHYHPPLQVTTSCHRNQQGQLPPAARKALFTLANLPPWRWDPGLHFLSPGATLEVHCKAVGHITLQQVQHSTGTESLPHGTYWCFLVDWFDDKFLVIEGDVSDFTPGEAYFGGQPAITATMSVIFSQTGRMLVTIKYNIECWEQHAV